MGSRIVDCEECCKAVARAADGQPPAFRRCRRRRWQGIARRTRCAEAIRALARQAGDAALGRNACTIGREADHRRDSRRLRRPSCRGANRHRSSSAGDRWRDATEIGRPCAGGDGAFARPRRADPRRCAARPADGRDRPFAGSVGALRRSHSSPSGRRQSRHRPLGNDDRSRPLARNCAACRRRRRFASPRSLQHTVPGRAIRMPETMRRSQQAHGVEVAHDRGRRTTSQIDLRRGFPQWRCR